jgi:antitoxin component of RelBE/YafQ-DinJ toxin-antitoxin module
MPKDPMKNRVVRVSDRIWDAAKARADERGESISDAVRKFLERYSR